MNKLKFCILGLILSSCFFVLLSNSAFGQAPTETLTIVTYYPSPHGVYDSLQAWRFAVGDLNDNGNLDPADIPATNGYLMVDERVGIGLGTQTPQNRLDIEGGAVIGATYSGTNTAPPDGLLVEGRVGINTINPQTSLHIHDTGNPTVLFDTDGTDWYIGINDAASDMLTIGRGTSVGSNINLLLHGQGIGICSQNACNIGVPQTPLHVEGGMRLDHRGLNPGMIQFFDSGNIERARIRYNQTAGLFRFNVSGGTNFAMMGGNVGINTTDPGTYRVYIVGDVYIDGDLTVNGTIFKQASTFIIDHPLDPLNKVLRHSVVESPDIKNVYDGVATLDKNGESTIKLPDYFEALNKDFRYQLTCIGKSAPLYIKEEVKDNKFVIAGGKPGMKVCWQITGIRKDPAVLKNPIIVEQEKGLDGITKKGEYIAEDCFGS